MTRTAVATEEEPQPGGWNHDFTITHDYRFKLMVVETDAGEIKRAYVTARDQHTRWAHVATSMLDWYTHRQLQRVEAGDELVDVIRDNLDAEFAPYGMTDDREVWMCRSVIDYVFRKIGLRYLTDEQKQQLGLLRPRPFGLQGSRPDSTDAPMCYLCGVQMQRAGSCHACPSCGATSGCD